jgi:hypothetical protein
MDNETAFVKIIALDDVIQAQLVESILKEENIPHQIRSFHDTAYDGLFQFQKGYGEVWAPLEYRQDILDVMTHIKNSENKGS